jgi:putative endonuclease
MRNRNLAVSILASQRNGTLYAGGTSDLIARVAVHGQDLIPGFRSRYGVHRLVHWEEFSTMDEANAPRKPLKTWGRARKIALVEAGNPGWLDVWPELSGEPPEVCGAQ